MTLLANLSGSDTGGLVTLLLVIIGIVGLGLGVWLAFHERLLAAGVSAVIGLVALFVAL